MTTTQSIHEAATRGDLAEAQALLAATPALANARDEHGWVPLFYAGHYGHKQMVELLLAHGADATIDHGQVLHYTMQRRHKDIMEVLIAHDAFDSYVRPPNQRIRDLFLAIFRAQSDRLAAMLRHDPDLINTRGHAGWTLLHYAAEHGDLSVGRGAFGQWRRGAHPGAGRWRRHAVVSGRNMAAPRCGEAVTGTRRRH